jgi:NAD(P)-dependent dehydrogenase (short-subunit alcohol dehydrogenase family)
MNQKPLAIVLGAGVGLGESLCKKFQSEGYEVVGLNRTVHSDSLVNVIEVDLFDTESVNVVLDAIQSQFGTPEVVIHNTAQLTIKPFLETSIEEYEQAWKSMSQSLFVVMQNLLPNMQAAGKGSVIVSGATASLRGSAKFAAFASAKFALRGLTQSLAREFQTHGIHVAHVLLDGIIDTDRSRDLHSLDPSRMIKPDDIAAQYLALIQQPASAWTHELDLRPSCESF